MISEEEDPFTHAQGAEQKNSVYKFLYINILMEETT